MRKIDQQLRAQIHQDSQTGILEALRMGADPSAKDDAGGSQLMEAIAANRCEAVRLLIEAGADVRARDMWGQTALHKAAERGRYINARALEMLIEAGAEVDLKDGHGRAPLHGVAKNGGKEAMRVLLAAGAALEEKDEEGKTPLDWAREKMMDEMEQMLLAERVRREREGLEAEAGAGRKDAARGPRL